MCFEGITRSVLRNFPLYTEPVEHETRFYDGNDDPEDILNVALEQDVNQVKNGLEDFTVEDDVYEEFDSHRTTYGAYEWKNNKKPALAILSETLWSIFSIFGLACFGIGTLCVVFIFVNVNTICICADKPWEYIPEDFQRIIVVIEVVEAWLMNYLHALTMVFTFGYRFVADVQVLHFNTILAFLDSMYRLCLQLFNNYGWRGKQLPSGSIFVILFSMNSYIISTGFGYPNRKPMQQLWSSLQMGFQFALIGLIYCALIYFGVPFFLQVDGDNKAVVSIAAGILGCLIKTISRIPTQSISRVNHPGSSYALVIVAYASCTFTYRLLQADTEELLIFTSLSVIQSIIGLVERLSNVFCDHFGAWCYYTCCMCQQRRLTHIGVFRTPRSQRTVADITICSIIQEISIIAITNTFVQLYPLQRGFSMNSESAIDVSTTMKKVGMRTLIAASIEAVFSMVAVFILTWGMNIPMLRVWKKKWKIISTSNLIVLSILTLPISRIFMQIIQPRYDTNVATTSMDCYPKRSLFF